MITKEEVKKIAELAMLRLKDDEIEKFCDQFNEILEYMEEINSLDLSKQEAAFHITELKNVFKEDEPGGSIDNKTALSNAPEAEDGFFKVPRVI